MRLSRGNIACVRKLLDTPTGETAETCPHGTVVLREFRQGMLHLIKCDRGRKMERQYLQREDRIIADLLERPDALLR
jgi:hypothetical protein